MPVALVFQVVLVAAASIILYLAYQCLDLYRYDMKTLKGSGDFITVGAFFGMIIFGFIGILLLVAAFL